MDEEPGSKPQIESKQVISDNTNCDSPESTELKVTKPLAESDKEETIKDGDFVVIQRHDYMRTQKLIGAKNCLIQLGRDSVELKNVIGHPYGSAFQMQPHDSRKKTWKVEKISEVLDFEEHFLDENEQSGQDNRNLRDTNTEAQGLKKEQILFLSERE